MLRGAVPLQAMLAACEGVDVVVREFTVGCTVVLMTLPATFLFRLSKPRTQTGGWPKSATGLVRQWSA